MILYHFSVQSYLCADSNRGIFEKKEWVFNFAVQLGVGFDLHGPALHLKQKVKNTQREFLQSCTWTLF